MLRILYPIIEKLVLKKDLMTKIKDLQNKNELDEEAYLKLKKKAVSLLFINVGLPLCCYLLFKVCAFLNIVDARLEPVIVVAVMLIIFFAYSSMRRYEFTRVASCYNVGVPQTATITSIRTAGPGVTHSVRYKFSYNNHEWFSATGIQFSLKFGVYLRSKEDRILLEHFPFPQRGLSVGDTIVIFIIPNKTKKPVNYMYMCKTFKQICINKNVQKFWQSELIATRENQHV